MLFCPRRQVSHHRYLNIIPRAQIKIVSTGIFEPCLLSKLSKLSRTPIRNTEWCISHKLRLGTHHLCKKRPHACPSPRQRARAPCGRPHSTGGGEKRYVRMYCTYLLMYVPTTRRLGASAWQAGRDMVEAGAGKHKRRQRAGERRELARGKAMRGNTIKAMRGIQHGIRMAKTPEDRPRAGHDTINSGTKANAI